jgi:predicted Zn-dependent protease
LSSLLAALAAAAAARRAAAANPQPARAPLAALPRCFSRHRLTAAAPKSNPEKQAQAKEEARAEGRLLPDAHPAARLVRRVGGRIAAVAARPETPNGRGAYGHMAGLQWEYAVIQSAVPNAFVVPGGKVVVYTGARRARARADRLCAF